MTSAGDGEHKFAELGPRVVHFLRTCIPFVSHSLISSHAEFVSYFSSIPEHPEKPYSDAPPEWLWELGRGLSTFEFGHDPYRQLGWEAL